MTIPASIRTGASSPVEWRLERRLVPYPEALGTMEERVAAIAEGRAPELVWLLEHPPLYTAGTSAKPGDLIAPDRFPVYEAGRGGQYTYHGPGQRVGYVMLDLARRGRPDLRRYVQDLENWLVRTLSRFGVQGERRPGRTEAKIAAVGVRVRHWTTFHGVALNVNPDLSHYAGIVPCGIRDAGVTDTPSFASEVTPRSAMPQGTIPSKCDSSGSRLIETP